MTAIATLFLIALVLLSAFGIAFLSKLQLLIDSHRQRWWRAVGLTG